MAKKKKEGILSKKQEKKLQNMVNDMLDIANSVVKEYEDLDFSELADLSGSLTQIHEDSPFLDDIFKGDSWKKVITNIPNMPKNSDGEKEEDDS